MFDGKTGEESDEVGRTKIKRGRPRTRWRDCIEIDMRKAELEDVDWRIWSRIEDSGGGSSTGRQRRVSTLTPDIRETRKRERYINIFRSPQVPPNLNVHLIVNKCYTTFEFI